MPPLSKKDIIDRIYYFADLIGKGSYFKPQQTWWLLSNNQLSMTKHPNVLSFLEQLNIPLEDMKKHFTTFWTGKIGTDFFSDVLLQVKEEHCIFVTVLSSDLTKQSRKSSPMDQSAYLVEKEAVTMQTRSTSWTSLRLAIIGENNGTSSAFPTETENKSSSKKNSFVDAIEDIMYGESTNILDTDMDVLEPETSIRDDGNTEYPEFTVNDIYIMNYWYSSEAGKIFGTLPEEKSALEAIQNQISSLSEAIETADGFKTIVVPSVDAGDDLELFVDSISKHQLYMVMQKCQTIMMALTIAINLMETKHNFYSCCEKAIEMCRLLRIPSPKNAKTITNWYRSFRLHDRKIVVPYLPKQNKPLFLTEFPEKAIIISDYAKSNLATMSGEMMSQYIHATILPQIVKEEYKVDSTDESYDTKLQMVCRFYYFTVNVVTP
jgi:hypothetical protein